MYIENVFIDNNASLPLLSHEETLAYLKKAQSTPLKNNRAIEFLIFSNKGLIFKLVAKYQCFLRPPLDRSDLISICLKSFVRSIQLFDVSKGFHFSTYAYKSMQFEIWQELEKFAYPIRIPNRVLRQHYKSSNQKFLLQNPYSPNDDFDSSVSEGVYDRSIPPLPLKYVSLDQNISIDSQLKFEDIISDGQNGVDDFESSFDLDVLLNYLETFLTINELYVIKNYFGINTIPLTFKIIAKDLDVTKSSVSKYYKSALSKICDSSRKATFSLLLTGNGRYK